MSSITHPLNLTLFILAIIFSSLAHSGIITQSYGIGNGVGVGTTHENCLRTDGGSSECFHVTTNQQSFDFNNFDSTLGTLTNTTLSVDIDDALMVYGFAVFTSWEWTNIATLSFAVEANVYSGTNILSSTYLVNHIENTQCDSGKTNADGNTVVCETVNDQFPSFDALSSVPINLELDPANDNDLELILTTFVALDYHGTCTDTEILVCTDVGLSFDKLLQAFNPDSFILSPFISVNTLILGDAELTRTYEEFPIVDVPEPGTFMLLFAGISLFSFVRRKHTASI